jgi:hypothetical protein
MDGGLDINVYNDGGNEVDPGILLNFGAGADVGTGALMGEVTTLVITGDGGESISAAALSMRGNAGRVQPYAALLLPLDEEASDIFDLALLAGVEGRM